jgi:hypothetical protein
MAAFGLEQFLASTRQVRNGEVPSPPAAIPGEQPSCPTTPSVPVTRCSRKLRSQSPSATWVRAEASEKSISDAHLARFRCAARPMAARTPIRLADFAVKHSFAVVRRLRLGALHAQTAALSWTTSMPDRHHPPQVKVQGGHTAHHEGSA